MEIGVMHHSFALIFFCSNLFIDINRKQTAIKYNFVYMDQESFEKFRHTVFKQLIDDFRNFNGKKITGQKRQFQPTPPLLKFAPT